MNDLIKKTVEFISATSVKTNMELLTDSHYDIYDLYGNIFSKNVPKKFIYKFLNEPDFSDYTFIPSQNKKKN